MAVELRRSRKVKERADALREACEQLGRQLPPGDSAERIVADKVEQIAQQMGISTRTVLDRYVTDESMRVLANALVRQMQDLTEVMDQAPPVPVSVNDGLLVLAAFGMCSAVALRNLDHSESADPLIVVRDAADSTVHIAVTLAQADDDPVDVGGFQLAIGRKVITTVLEQLRAGRWECTCGSAHRADGGCALQDRLALDLASLGGWATHGDS
ncbi:hypothetical protein AB0B31_11565 [Catellatospora citrea]|uniref:hypothetical protein n=1 Tax=Catellatospora citrea TaxID=53366 RepID=UPI0033DA4333